MSAYERPSQRELPLRPWEEIVKEWLEINDLPEAQNSQRYREVREELRALTKMMQQRQAERNQQQDTKRSEADKEQVEKEPVQPEQDRGPLQETIDGPATREEWERAQEELHDEKFGRFRSDEDEWFFGR